MIQETPLPKKMSQLRSRVCSFSYGLVVVNDRDHRRDLLQFYASGIRLNADSRGLKRPHAHVQMNARRVKSEISELQSQSASQTG
jgi:hypothetical protein